MIHIQPTAMVFGESKVYYSILHEGLYQHYYLMHERFVVIVRLMSDYVTIWLTEYNSGKPQFLKTAICFNCNSVVDDLKYKSI